MCWFDIPYIIFYHLAVNIGIAKSQEKQKSHFYGWHLNSTKMSLWNRYKASFNASSKIQAAKYASRAMKTIIVIFKYSDIVWRSLQESSEWTYIEDFPVCKCFDTSSVYMNKRIYSCAFNNILGISLPNLTLM